MKPFRTEFEKKKKIFQIFKQCQKSSECLNTLIIQYYYCDSKHNSLETAHGGHKVLKKNKEIRVQTVNRNAKCIFLILSLFF